MQREGTVADLFSFDVLIEFEASDSLMDTQTHGEREQSGGLDVILSQV